MRNYKKLILGLGASVFFLLCLSGCEKPHLSGIETEEIDMYRDPLQTPHPSGEPIIKEIKNGHLSLTPVAGYRVSGVMVGKKAYDSGWESQISPLDLAIVWGKLVEPAYDKYIEYWQNNRWYFFRYKEASPFDHSYVVTHSGNHHAIPANYNVRKALESVRKNDKVTLEGYLVNVKGTYRGKAVFWNTSLSRNDTGNGSCELLYVFKVRIDTRVYE
jgi:hypothetical protein